MSEIIYSSANLPWLIYSSSQEISHILLQSLTLDKIYFNNIDYVLSWLSENSTWSIISWGGNNIRFNSFVFISKNQSLRNLFINISPNTMDIQEIDYISHIPQTNLLISQYDVLEKFTDSTKVITFHQDQNIGNRVWNACNCDKNKPWIITTSFDEDEVVMILLFCVKKEN